MNQDIIHTPSDTLIITVLFQSGAFAIFVIVWKIRICIELMKGTGILSICWDLQYIHKVFKIAQQDTMHKKWINYRLSIWDKSPETTWQGELIISTYLFPAQSRVACRRQCWSDGGAGVRPALCPHGSRGHETFKTTPASDRT